MASTKGGKSAAVVRDEDYDSAGIDSNGLFESDNDDDNNENDNNNTPTPVQTTKGNKENTPKTSNALASVAPAPNQVSVSSSSSTAKKQPPLDSTTTKRNASIPKKSDKVDECEDDDSNKGQHHTTAMADKRSALDAMSGGEDCDENDSDNDEEKDQQIYERRYQEGYGGVTRKSESGGDNNEGSLLFDSCGEEGEPSQDKVSEPPKVIQKTSENKKQVSLSPSQNHGVTATASATVAPQPQKDTKNAMDVTFNNPSPVVEGITRYRSFTVKMGPGQAESYTISLNSYVECPPPAVKGRIKANTTTATTTATPTKLLPMIMGKMDAIAHDATLRGERVRIHRIIPWDKVPDLPDWMPVKVEGFPTAFVMDCWNTITYSCNLKGIKPIVVNESNTEKIVNLSKVLKKDLEKQAAAGQQIGLSKAARESGLDIKTTAKYWVLTDKYVSMYHTYVYETAESGKRSRKRSPEPSYKFLDVGSIDASQSIESYLENEGYTHPPTQTCLRDEKGFQRKKRAAGSQVSGGEELAHPPSAKVSHRSKASQAAAAAAATTTATTSATVTATRGKGGKGRKSKRNEDIMAVGDDETKGTTPDADDVHNNKKQHQDSGEKEKGRKRKTATSHKSGEEDSVTTTTTTTTTPKKKSDHHRKNKKEIHGDEQQVAEMAKKKPNEEQSQAVIESSKKQQQQETATINKNNTEHDLSSVSSTTTTTDCREKEQTLIIANRMKTVSDSILQAIFDLKKDGLHHKFDGVMMWTKMASGVAKSAAKFSCAHK